MKTLKFMLAAATAIGLASAAHADQLDASTGFEKWNAVEGTVVGTGYSDTGAPGQSSFYWEYAGDPDADNESKIVSSNMSHWASIRPKGKDFFTGADLGASSKILEVSTGTKPLLRRFLDNGSNFELGGTAGAAQLYVDTLVQFTVTPQSDSVTNSPEDKLMIYLKESPDGENKTVTNLVVKGGYYTQGYNIEPKDYVVHDLEIDPTQWYRLTVKAIPNFGNLEGESFPAFFVSINGVPCTFEDCAMEEDAGAYPDPFVDGTIDEDTFDAIDNKTFVFSMIKGSEETGVFGLRAVGFAGEGKVDDLVISTFDPAKTVIDFTFNVEDTVEGLATALGYSCSVSGQSGDVAVSPGTKTIKCFADDAITVTYALNTGFTADWTFTGGASISEGVVTPYENGSATLTITKNEPQVTPVEPGGASTYDSQAAAEAALAKVEIAVPSGVATAVTGNEAAYKSLFEAKIVDNGNGTYDVKVDFTATAAEDLAAEATTNVAVSVAAQLSEIAADATGEQTDVSVTGATPGLYYSISYGTAVDAINTEGDRVMAPASGSLTLQTPAKASGATAGFYKVNINAVPKPVVTP